MGGYTAVKKIKSELDLPRIPLNSVFEITYRCNNNCRHCWLRLPPGAEERHEEVQLDDIKRIVDEARVMGCRGWAISGGEPMLRPDFPEIFDYIARKSFGCSLNSNGTLITPEIAKLLKRSTKNNISVYGATAEVNDHITRNPGSFEATIRGLHYLKEAGVNFKIQIVPMKDNYHQLEDIKKLADSFGVKSRFGAEFLFLSALDNLEQRHSIKCQRLTPKQMLELNKPDPVYIDKVKDEDIYEYRRYEGEDRVFWGCVYKRNSFQIDPYGNLVFCKYIKDPKLSYNLKTGSFKEGWENVLPSLVEIYRFDKEYMENCGSCESRFDCHWCPAFAYLENRNYNSKVDYFCSIAKEREKYMDSRISQNRRYYQIAGITIQVDSELPIKDDTFVPKINKFQVNKPGEDIIKIDHRFSLPNMERMKGAKQVYGIPPWTIYKKDDSWIYVYSSSDLENDKILQIAAFNKDHTRSQIFSSSPDRFLNGNMKSLSLLTNDQILMAKILVDKEGCLLHSSGVIMDGKGLIFAGKPKSGKSTITKMLGDKVEVLCDERIILRRYSEGFKVYGTWHYSEITDISTNSAPLKGIIFLEKSQNNCLTQLNDKKEITKRLLECLVKPYVTADWWDKTLNIIDRIANEVPCYILEFDLSGKAVALLKSI